MNSVEAIRVVFSTEFFAAAGGLLGVGSACVHFSVQSEVSLSDNYPTFLGVMYCVRFEIAMPHSRPWNFVPRR